MSTLPKQISPSWRQEEQNLLAAIEIPIKYEPYIFLKNTQNLVRALVIMTNVMILRHTGSMHYNLNKIDKKSLY